MAFDPDTRRDPSTRVLLLGALAVVLTTLVVDLGVLPFYTKGEPREGLVVWDMVHRGDWILPLRNGTDVPSKPPLFHWLGALASLAAGGVSELTIRLPSLLLGLLGLLLTYRAGARRWGRRAGFIAALVLGTSFEWVRATTNARVDMTLTACLLVALLVVWALADDDRRRLPRSLLLALALALATLAKGPVGMVLPMVVAGAFMAVRRDASIARNTHLLLTAAVALTVAGSWYAAALWQGGEAFFAKQILQENLLRYVDTGVGTAGHVHAPLYLLPGLLGGMAPWSLLFPAAGVWLVRSRGTLARRQLAYPVTWFLTVLIFFSISSGKRSVYLLPAYPAAALLLGAWATAPDRGTERGVGLCLATAGATCAGVVLVVAALLLLALAIDPDVSSIAVPFLHPADVANLALVHTGARGASTLLAGCAVLALIGAGATLTAARRRAWVAAMAAVALGTAATTLPIRARFQPAVATARTLAPFMTRVRARVGPDAPLYFHGVFDYGAIFYARRHVPVLDAAPLPATQVPTFVLMRRSDWKRLADHRPPGLRVVERSRGLGPRGDRRLVLLRAANSAAATALLPKPSDARTATSAP